MNTTLYILKDTTDPNFPCESRSWIITSKSKTIDRMRNVVLESGNISVKLGNCVYVEDEDNNSLILIAYKMSDDLRVCAGHKYTFVRVSTYDVVREVEVIKMSTSYRIKLSVCDFATDYNQAFLTVDTPTGYLGVEPYIYYIDNSQTIIRFMDIDNDEWILKPTGRVTLCPFMKL